MRARPPGSSARFGRLAARAGGFGVVRLRGHRQGEGEPRPPARPAAGRVDAAAVRLDQPLADGQAQPVAPAGRPAVAARPGVLVEQARQHLRRHAPALVRDGDRHVKPVARRVDADGGGRGRAAGRVRDEVVQHLDDARLVRHHPRQVRRQVDLERVPAPAAEERVARLIHQDGHLGGPGLERQRAGVDASGVQQVAEQPVHAVGLLVDDAEELAGLGRLQHPRGAQRRGARALDGGQRRAQLVAHQAQELRPRALEVGAVRAGRRAPRVGDGRGRLRRQQHQDLLVLVRELFPALLVAQENGAEVLAAIAHGGDLQGRAGEGFGGEAERADPRAEVRQPERGFQVAQVLEEARSAGPLLQPAKLFGRKAGGQEVVEPPVLVHGGDGAVAGGGERARGLDHLVEDRFHIEARADAQDGRVEVRSARAQRFDFPLECLDARQCVDLSANNGSIHALYTTG